MPPAQVMTTPPCRVCGPGRMLPSGTTFCPECGRSVGQPADPSTARKATVVVTIGLVMVAMVVLVLMLGVGAVLVYRGWSSRPTVAAATPAVPRRPMAKPALPPDPPAVPPVAPSPTSDDAILAPAATEPAMPSVPARPGDVDLANDPSAAYANGPSADRLTIHGLRVGLAVSEVPAAMVRTAMPDRLVDTAGDVCVVDQGHIAEIHVRDPAVLAQLPVGDGVNVWNRFGETNGCYDAGDGSTIFRYPGRHLRVHWDFRVRRLVEIILDPPPAP